jgi:hypothetical protein
MQSDGSWFRSVVVSVLMQRSAEITLLFQEAGTEAFPFFDAFETGRLLIPT